MIWLSFEKSVGALKVFSCARAKRFNLRGIIRFIAAAIACIEGHYAHAADVNSWTPPRRRGDNRKRLCRAFREHGLVFRDSWLFDMRREFLGPLALAERRYVEFHPREHATRPLRLPE